MILIFIAHPWQEVKLQYFAKWLSVPMSEQCQYDRKPLRLWSIECQTCEFYFFSPRARYLSVWEKKLISDWLSHITKLNLNDVNMHYTPSVFFSFCFSFILLLLCFRKKKLCRNHTVTYCLSQHSQEFMSPAIDLWQDAQDRGHGCLTLTGMLVKAVLASLKEDMDSQQSLSRWLT